MVRNIPRTQPRIGWSFVHNMLQINGLYIFITRIYTKMERCNSSGKVGNYPQNSRVIHKLFSGPANYAAPTAVSIRIGITTFR